MVAFAYSTLSSCKNTIIMYTSITMSIIDNEALPIALILGWVGHRWFSEVLCQVRVIQVGETGVRKLETINLSQSIL